MSRHSTYLHAGPRPGVGWPVDQTTEDTFDLPPKLTGIADGEDAALDHFMTNALPEVSEERTYSAEYDLKGKPALVLQITKTTVTARAVASFENMDLARKAVQALNEHEGY